MAPYDILSPPRDATVVDEPRDLFGRGMVHYLGSYRRFSFCVPFRFGATLGVPHFRVTSTSWRDLYPLDPLSLGSLLWIWDTLARVRP